MKTLRMIATLLSLGLPAGAWASGAITPKVGTAGELAELCGANPKDAAADARINFCHGFAQGAVDMEQKYAGDKRKFCFPSPTPTRTATMSEFVNWVRALPAHRSLGPTEGLFQFLGERFPCK